MAKRLALITGGMGGLGATITSKMVEAGYEVVVTALAAERAIRRPGLPR